MHRKFCSIAFATVSLFTGIGSRGAEAMSPGPSGHAFGVAGINGVSARVEVKMAFAGRDVGTGPTLALNAGPVWQEPPSSSLFPTYYTPPIVSLGFSYSGKPVLKLGAFQPFKSQRLYAQEQSDHTLRNIVLGVAAAVAIAGLALAIVVHEVCESLPEPEPGDPSCP